MPSAEFHSIDVSKITVNREGRQRREPQNISELAQSIRNRGLINPILVQRESLELVAGERRLLAVKMLGWTHITAQFEDEVDEDELFALELEENTKREDLPWQDQVKAIQRYHEFCLEKDSTWTQAKTAEALGIQRTVVSQNLSVAEELQAGNEAVAAVPKLSTARNIVARAKERRAAEVLETIRNGTAEPMPAGDFVVKNEDFVEWSSFYSGPRFNFIHCDFPYGINADNRHQGSAHLEHGSYSDTPDEYFSLLAALAAAIPKVAQESSHLLFWFSMHHYHSTLDFLRENTPFKVDPFPLVWIKSDNKGLLPDAQRGPRRVYETAFFGSMGDRKVVRAISNAIAEPTAVAEGHMSVKPVPMLSRLFEMFIDETTSIFDPTAGSGSALRAARALGASRGLGLEKDTKFAERANFLLRQQTEE